MDMPNGPLVDSLCYNLVVTDADIHPLVLEPKRELAAQAIASGDTVTTAAAKAGVARQRLYDWGDVFWQRVEEIERENCRRVQRYFAKHAYDLAGKMLAIATGDAHATPTQLEALKTALSHAIGRPGQQSVSVEALQDGDRQVLRVIVGHPPGKQPGWSQHEQP
jgi:FAD/FMN-containing dehydrogenase